jgi:hypothetical protein
MRVSEGDDDDDGSDGDEGDGGTTINEDFKYKKIVDGIR